MEIDLVQYSLEEAVRSFDLPCDDALNPSLNEGLRGSIETAIIEADSPDAEWVSNDKVVSGWAIKKEELNEIIFRANLDAKTRSTT